MKKTLLLLVLVISSIASMAGNVLTQYLSTTSMTVGGQIRVADPVRQLKYYNNSICNYSARVALVYGREDKTDLPSANWSLSLTYKLTFFDENYTQQGTPITGNTLDISFNSSNPVYLASKLFENTTNNFPNVLLEITALTPTGSIPNDVRLELTLVNKHDHQLAPLSPAITYRSTDSTLYWPYMKGAENYQVEWVYVDNQDVHATFSANSDPFTYKEPVRISTTNQYYNKFNFTYPAGNVYMRVRGAGKFLNNTDNTTERYTSWYYVSTPLAISSSIAKTNKNWQYVTAYVEGGKYKKIMSYYDGSMRNRQSLTNLSSEDAIVAAESKYDYEGRGTVSILPTPLAGSSLGYKPNLNSFTNGKHDYDKELATSYVPSLTATSASSTYYSASNTVEIAPFKDFIPQANGYTFFQVQYTEDGTGRPIMQGGIGETFRLQNPTLGAHYTRYKYTNADATELQRLFGSNVGEASHYKKKYVIDPNGQISVSYLDQEARVVATSLAGNAPANVNPLLSNVKYTIPVSLDGNNVIDKTTRTSRSVSIKNNLVVGTQYRFRYSMKGVINQAGSYINTCKSCTYDLKITITDPDGYIVPTTPIVVNNISPASFTCSDASYLNTDIVDQTFAFAKEGEYTITKELTLSSGAIDLLLTSLSSQPGYPQLTTYETAALASINYSSCDLTCEDHCRSEVFRLNPTWKNNSAIPQSQIETAVSNCMTTNCTGYVNTIVDKVSSDECKSIYNQILQQVSPGGVLNTTTWLTPKFSLITNWGATTPTSVADLMDQSKFTQEWAQKLAPYHNEYCHYINCGSFSDSRAFDMRMAIVTDWTGALAAGYLSPTPIAIDPFFNADRYPNMGHDPATTSAASAMATTLANYKTESQLNVDVNADGDKLDQVSLEQFVNSYFPYGTNTSYTPALTEKWNLYKSLYIGAKTAIIKQVFAGAFGASVYYVPCSYQTGADIVVADPTLPSDQTAINNLNNQNMAASCQTGCPENVKVWMSMLKNKCFAPAQPVTSASMATFIADSTFIATNLLSYCNAKCGYLNPFGLVMLDDIATNGLLINSQLRLQNSYSCSLNYIAFSDPYTYDCTAGGVEASYWNLDPVNCGSVYTVSIPNRAPDAVVHTNDINVIGSYMGPAPGINPTSFIARFSASINAPVTGNYTFVLQVDNAVKVYIDNVNVYSDPFTNTYICNGVAGNGFHYATIPPILLTAGHHSIVIEYVQGYSIYQCALYWQKPGDSSGDLANFGGCVATGIKQCPFDLNPSSNCEEPLFSLTPCAKELIYGIAKLVKAKRSQSYINGCPGNCWQEGTVYYNNDRAQMVTPVQSSCNSHGASYTFISGEFPSTATTDLIQLYSFINYTPSAYVDVTNCPIPSKYKVSSTILSIASVRFFVRINGVATYIPKNSLVSVGDPFIDCQEVVSGSTNLNYNNLSDPVKVHLEVENFNGVTGIQNLVAYVEFAPFIGPNEQPYQITWKLPQASTIPLNTLCNATFPIDYVRMKNDCRQELEDIATFQAHTKWQAAVDKYKSDFLAQYYNKCMDNPFDEDFTVEYESNEYHYTLYYYDQAGNLVQTVPPAGVNPLPASAFNNGVWIAGNEPQHHLMTKYKYNALNLLLSQYSPDGGESNFWYNSKGMLRLSQNAKQLAASTTATNQYSYTNFDELGRIIEVGQLQNSDKTLSYMTALSNKKDIMSMLDDPAFPTMVQFDLKQITHTYYDASIDPLSQNLRGRVASVETKPDETTIASTMTYSYDIHGNVKCLKQDIAGFATKKMEYGYDLLSSKVNNVYYQKGQSDQFIHQYEYDSDNRICGVFTSADGANWEEDARYLYYKHGPLARTELGQDKVQGLDHYYTLQGWHKGVNTPAPRNLSNGQYRTGVDPGQDGMVSSGTGLNRFVAQDEFAYTLGYYNGDYTPSGTTISLGAAGSNNWNASDLNANILGEGLYNGNITWMATQVQQMGYRTPGYNTRTTIQNESYGLRSYAYQYDQLNRITHAFNYNDYSTSWSRLGAINTVAFDANYTYDPNGNILTAQINGPTASFMDDLRYLYMPNFPNDGFISSNRLIDVVDNVGDQGYGDLRGTQATPFNYVYDEIGNLTQDKSEDAIITWTVYGKVASVTHNNPYMPKLYFTYDGAGNRIKKSVSTTTYPNTTTTVNTYYVRDASGNVMATYTIDGVNTQTEYSIYGLSRLGTWIVPVVTNGVFKRQAVTKQYELGNHLGNVLATVAAFKTGVDIDADNKADYYTSYALSGNDYYAFGMAMPLRSFMSSEYEYGFNGKENDPETRWQDYGMRIYNPRLGRFLSVDPITDEYPELTPYQFASNRPIDGIDKDGLEYYGPGVNTGTPLVSAKDAMSVLSSIGNSIKSGYLKAANAADSWLAQFSTPEKTKASTSPLKVNTVIYSSGGTDPKAVLQKRNPKAKIIPIDMQDVDNATLAVGKSAGKTPAMKSTPAQRAQELNQQRNKQSGPDYGNQFETPDSPTEAAPSVSKPSIQYERIPGQGYTYIEWTPVYLEVYKVTVQEGKILKKERVQLPVKEAEEKLKNSGQVKPSTGG